MKTLYENPEVKFLKFTATDVITTSGGCDDDCDMDFGASMGVGNCA